MLWTKDNSLTDIQHILENLYSKNMRLHVKAIDILDISEEEYYILADKVKLISTPEDIQFYSLSMFTGWVLSYTLEKNKEYFRMIRHNVSKMPQHHTKYVLDSVNTTCYDYQVDTFGKPINSMKDIDAIAKRHAGF